MPLVSSNPFVEVSTDYVRCQLLVMYLLMNRLHNSDGLVVLVAVTEQMYLSVRCRLLLCNDITECIDEIGYSLFGITMLRTAISKFHCL